MNQENVKEDKPANEKGKEDKGNCHFAYFIDTHEKTKKFKIYLSDEYEGANSLEKVQKKEKDVKKDEMKEVGKDEKQICPEVYRFKIIPGALKKDEDEKYQILVLAEDENQKKAQYIIKFMDDNKDYYEYDFNIEELDEHILSHEEQFEIYVEILRSTYKKQMATPENENLIASTNRFFDEEGKKYSFFFYLFVFLECYKTKYIQQHLLKFSPEKIEGVGNIPETKIKKMTNLLKIISKNPGKVLNVENSKDEVELIEIFYSILLYFNMNFQKDKVLEMFQDEKILGYLFKKLISFRNLYKDLILPKDIIRTLIKKSKTFEEILGFLFYIGTDIIDFLQLINSEFEFIKNIYVDELNKLTDENENLDIKDRKEMKKIEVEKYIMPKRVIILINYLKFQV